jgi:hypothetical protein
MTHNELGQMGEAYVYQLLTGIGLSVEFGGPADLLVNGTPVEVKAARPAPYRGDGRRGYQFCLHREGTRGVQAPVVILLCYWSEKRDPVAFVIPADRLGERRKVAITGYPWSYSGRWSGWYDRWEALGDVIENAQGVGAPWAGHNEATQTKPTRSHYTNEHGNRQIEGGCDGRKREN